MSHPTPWELALWILNYLIAYSEADGLGRYNDQNDF